MRVNKTSAKRDNVGVCSYVNIFMTFWKIIIFPYSYFPVSIVYCYLRVLCIVRLRGPISSALGKRPKVRRMINATKRHTK